MKFYIISGEASGDLHASNLVREIQQRQPGARFRGWGGDLMAARGVELVRHYRDLAFMGFVEVISNLRTILRNIEFCRKDIAAYKPDAVILVDYPGFNLRMAQYVAEMGIRVIYYISPQVWAWKQSRVHQIKKYVDQMLVILPFEAEFYERFAYHADFVGHPLLDAIGEYRRHDRWMDSQGLHGKPVVALLPGSRKQEIKTMLPVMMEVAKSFPGHAFVVAGAPSVPDSVYHEAAGTRDIKLVTGATYDLLCHAEAALVTSGTATLETALFRVPEVVCYKGNRISYQIARRLVKINYISLVNLIMDRHVVRELIQDEMNAETVKAELHRLLHDAPYRDAMRNDFELLREKLGGPGASGRAAGLILSGIGAGY